MNKKICVSCSVEKEIIEFAKHSENKYRPNCLICQRKKDREYRLAKIMETDIVHGLKIIDYRKDKEKRGDCKHDEKWCYICKSYKNFSLFSKTNLNNYGCCTTCSSLSDIQRARILKLKALDYLGGNKCSKCDFSGHYASMHFHHINPNLKSMNWNVTRKKTWRKIILELNKCIILCANCHITIHSKLNNDGTFNEEYIPSGKNNQSLKSIKK